MIFCIEGPNGIGKSSLINSISNNYNNLTQDYQQLRFLKFPDKNTRNGSFIYEMLNRNEIDQNALAMLFVNERYNNKNYMKSCLFSPEITIIDRYSPSNINSLSAKVIYESRNTVELFTTEDIYKDGFVDWFEQVAEYLVNKVIDELYKYEMLEQDLKIIQPHRYVLLVPKNDWNTYQILYGRNFKNRTLDTHESFSQFVFTSLVYRKCAYKGMFSRWSIIEIDENMTMDVIYKHFKSIFDYDTMRIKEIKPCEEIVLNAHV